MQKEFLCIFCCILCNKNSCCTSSVHKNSCAFFCAQSAPTILVHRAGATRICHQRSSGQNMRWCANQEHFPYISNNVPYCVRVQITQGLAPSSSTRSHRHLTVSQCQSFCEKIAKLFPNLSERRFALYEQTYAPSLEPGPSRQGWQHKPWQQSLSKHTSECQIPTNFCECLDSQKKTLIAYASD